jgi:hypothetical protein
MSDTRGLRYLGPAIEMAKAAGLFEEGLVFAIHRGRDKSDDPLAFAQKIAFFRSSNRRILCVNTALMIT